MLLHYTMKAIFIYFLKWSDCLKLQWMLLSVNYIENKMHWNLTHLSRWLINHILCSLHSCSLHNQSCGIKYVCTYTQACWNSINLPFAIWTLITNISVLQFPTFITCVYIFFKHSFRCFFCLFFFYLKWHTTRALKGFK